MTPKPWENAEGYDQFERDLLLEVDEDIITAGTAGVLVGKLLQFCNGAVYGNDGKVVPVHDCKLEAYSEKSASRIAIELLNKTHVSAEIQKRQAKLRGKLEITQERVLEELAAIAFANGTDFATITHNGLVRLTPTDEVPEEKKKAVASIKEGQYGTEIKLHDKVRALELLGKHLGVFDTNNGSANEQENNIFEVIEESTREEIGTDEIPEIEPPAKPGHDLVE